MKRVEKTRHFIGGLALEAHGQAEGADLEIAHGAVEHLSEQVGGLRAFECARAVLAAPDFFQMVFDAHCRHCAIVIITYRY